MNECTTTHFCGSLGSFFLRFRCTFCALLMPLVCAATAAAFWLAAAAFAARPNAEFKLPIAIVPGETELVLAGVVDALSPVALAPAKVG